MILIFSHSIYLQVFLSDLIILEEENAIKYAKRLPSKKDESLKIYSIFGFSPKPMGTISSDRKHVFEKVLQKRLNTKIFISDKPEFCGAIGAGLFAVDSDRLLERLECNALNINPKNPSIRLLIA